MLTRRQAQVLQAVEDATAALGYPPTVRELAYVLNLKSTSTVHAHLSILRKLGYVRWDSAHARTLRVVRREDGTPRSA